MSTANLLAPIQTTVGEIVTITLEDNPSTGFTVGLSQLPKGLVLMDDEYIPSTSRLMGAPGTRRFTFVAVEQGEGPLTFNRVKFTHPEPTVEPSNPMENRFVHIGPAK